jgi:hypothetical protein
MIFVGVDGGLRGAFVVLDKDQKIIEKIVMPIIKEKGRTMYDVKGIVNFFHLLMLKHMDSQIFVCLEKSYTRPVQGIRSAFNTGYGYGIMQGVLEALGISYETVTPQTWMKELGITSKNEKGSILFCQRKYPNERWTSTERCKKPHNGYTDACCLAIFGLRKNGGGLQSKL